MSINGFIDFSLKWIPNFLSRFLPLFSSWIITILIGTGAVLVLRKMKLFKLFLKLALIALVAALAVSYFLQPPAPAARPFRIADEFQEIHKQLIPYFGQVGKNFPAEPPSVAMYPFSITGGGEPPLLKYLMESMTLNLAANRRLKLGLGLPRTAMGIPKEEITVLEGLPVFKVDPELVRRQIQIPDSTGLAGSTSGGQKADYILFGKVTPLGGRVRLNIQIVNTNTAQILEAFNHDFNREDLAAFL
jgi:hypothetical protein